jgi:hypothetical protein
MHLLSQGHFLSTCCRGCLKANSSSESENSAVKRDGMDPEPNMAIDRAQEAIQMHETKRVVGLAEVVDGTGDSSQDFS